MHLAFDPPFAPIQTAFAAMLCGVAGLWVYINRSGAKPMLTGLRLLVLVALSIILVNPVVISETARPRGKPPFILLLDASRSMCTEDANGRSRFDAAKDATVNSSAFWGALARK